MILNFFTVSSFLLKGSQIKKLFVYNHEISHLDCVIKWKKTAGNIEKDSLRVICVIFGNITTA